MIQYLMLFLLLTNASVDADAAMGGLSPVVFPTAMPSAAQMISDVLSEEMSWRAGIEGFLNNSTNLTNRTNLIIA